MPTKLEIILIVLTLLLTSCARKNGEVCIKGLLFHEYTQQDLQKKNIIKPLYNEDGEQRTCWY